MKRYSKYNARKVLVDGHTFDSTKEAVRYQELKFLEKAGEIKELELQPKFVLQDDFICGGKGYREICYIADFMYTDKDGQKVVEDVKGYKTDVYALKKKLFLKKYCLNGRIKFIES